MPTDDARVHGEPLGLRPGCSTPRLYDECVRIFRTKHYSPRTEKSYLGWMRRFIAFNGGRHPLELDVDDVNAFLSHLATARNVSASTQRIALSAVLFLYKEVFDEPLERVENIIRAKKPKRLPDVLTRQEAALVFSLMSGVPRLVAMLQYGSGMRLNEALSLRVKDLDFERGEIVVRRGKGGRDRVTVLPQSLIEPLKRHLEIVRAQHLEDLARGLGRVPLPHALARKYPSAETDWSWHWVFPASSYYVDRQTRVKYKFHLHDSGVQKAVSAAGRASGLGKRVTTHIFRHSFATQSLIDGCDIRTVQDLLGHASVKTTQVYLHVLNRGGLGVRSPLDALDLNVNRDSYPAREDLLKNHSPAADQRKENRRWDDYPDRDNRTGGD